MIITDKYINGNYEVTLFEDGTKTRVYEGIPIPVYPESIDVKITNYCDAGCAYCHEKSTRAGKHANLSLGLRVLKNMPRGTELAIGGGNPLAHPDLIPFLATLKERGIIANLTVNQLHLLPFKKSIDLMLEKELIKGLGISLFKPRIDELASQTYSNTVLHMIMGVHTPKDLEEVVAKTPISKILLLGYKNFGRGENYYTKLHTNIEKSLEDWRISIFKFFNRGLIISFDNLGIKQIEAIRFFSKKDWNSFYMGDDGQFTMYMDLVDKNYGVSSTSKTRYNLTSNMIIEDIFSTVRKENNENKRTYN